MAELEQLRNQINQVDERLVALLKQRFEIVEAGGPPQPGNGGAGFFSTPGRGGLERGVGLLANEEYQTPVAPDLITILD